MKMIWSVNWGKSWRIKIIEKSFKSRRDFFFFDTLINSIKHKQFYPLIFFSRINLKHHFIDPFKIPFFHLLSSIQTHSLSNAHIRRLITPFLNPFCCLLPLKVYRHKREACSALLIATDLKMCYIRWSFPILISLQIRNPQYGEKME